MSIAKKSLRSVTSHCRKERWRYLFPWHEQYSRLFRFARAAWLFGGPPPDPAGAHFLRQRSATDLSSYVADYYCIMIFSAERGRKVTFYRTPG
jgi:hypothetical protein